MESADGYFRILGRVDDVINVAGHRLGTKEIESAALTVPEVAEAAAVPVIDDIRGRVVEVYVSLKPGFEPSKEMEDKVSKTIETVIGKIARPKNVWIVADMPKTRSGKIMRRVIAAVSNFADVGDITTLANPEIVEDDPASGAGGEGRARRGAARADRGRTGRDQVVRRRVRSLTRVRRAAVTPVARRTFFFRPNGPWLVLPVSRGAQPGWPTSTVRSSCRNDR